MAKKLQVVSSKPFQSDWDVTDESSIAYIRNKPNLSDIVKMKNVILYASLWTGEGTYTQSITLADVTPNSKIDIQPDDNAMNTIIAGNYRLLIKNDNGVVTAYVFGTKPSTDLNLQLTITEIAKENDLDVIWSNVI